MTFKTTLSLLLLSWIGSGAVNAQTSCDSVSIELLQYAAFNDTVLNLEVENSSTAFFSYPGFVLLATNGDTIASETVDLFGIAGTSHHRLGRHAGTPLATQGTVQATLYLWSGFYTTLECSWPVTFEPCPPAPCSPIHVYLANTGSAVVADTIDWQVFNSTGQLAGSGSFELGLEQMDSDVVCLESGSYTLELESPLSTGGQLFYGLTDSVGFSGYIQSVYMQGAATNSTPFDYFIACPQLVNAVIGAPSPARFQVMPEGNGVFISLSDTNAAGIVSVYDISGKLLLDRILILNEAFVDLGSIASGLLLFSVEQEGQQSTIKYKHKGQ